MLEIKLIPKESVAEIWPGIEKWVQNAIGDDKSWHPDDIKSACCNGKFYLWLIYQDKLKGFLIASIYDTPQMKCAYAPWLGGEDLESWVESALEKFKEFLRSVGVKQYSFIGRKAWKRLLNAESEQNFYLIKL